MNDDELRFTNLNSDPQTNFLPNDSMSELLKSNLPFKNLKIKLLKKAGPRISRSPDRLLFYFGIGKATNKFVPPLTT